MLINWSEIDNGKKKFFKLLEKQYVPVRHAVEFLKLLREYYNQLYDNWLKKEIESLNKCIIIEGS